MAISIINSTSVAQASGTSIVITHGFTIAADDLLVAVINSNGDNMPHASSSSLFTQAYLFSPGSGSTYTASVWTRKAGSSEGSTYTFTVCNEADRASIILYQIRGVDTTTCWDVAPSVDTDTNGVSASVTVPSITIATAGALGILAAGGDSGSATLSDPTNGYGSEVEVEAGGQATACYTQTWGSTGATGTATVTLSASLNNWGFHMALKPAVTLTCSVSQVAADILVEWA